MMKSNLLTLSFLYCLLCVSLLGSAATQASDRHEVRFYKANKLLQKTRISFVRKQAKQPGCHNFKLKARIHQLNQIGYLSCSLYKKKDCAEDSIIQVNRLKDETPVEKITPGFSWFTIGKNPKGVKAKSWSCSLSN